MRVEDKIEAFERMAVSAAQEKKRAAAKEMESRFNSLVDDAVREETQKYQGLLRAERYKVERNKNKELVDLSGKAKREFIAWRDKLTEDLFNNILNDVKEFTDSPGYKASLIGNINKAAQDGKYEAVQLTSKDMRCSAEISSGINLPLEEAPDDFIGGFRLISAGRRAVSDHTLAGMLKDRRMGFSLMASAKSSNEN